MRICPCARVCDCVCACFPTFVYSFEFHILALVWCICNTHDMMTRVAHDHHDFRDAVRPEKDSEEVPKQVIKVFSLLRIFMVTAHLITRCTCLRQSLMLVMVLRKKFLSYHHPQWDTADLEMRGHPCTVDWSWCQEYQTTEHVWQRYMPPSQS